jgi:hypothetical protein
VAASANCNFRIVRDTSSEIAVFELTTTSAGAADVNIEVPPGGIQVIDTGATAGPHTWKIQGLIGAATSAAIKKSSIMAFEQ